MWNEGWVCDRDGDLKIIWYFVAVARRLELVCGGVNVWKWQKWLWKQFHSVLRPVTFSSNFTEHLTMILCSANLLPDFSNNTLCQYNCISKPNIMLTLIWHKAAESQACNSAYANSPVLSKNSIPPLPDSVRPCYTYTPEIWSSHQFCIYQKATNLLIHFQTWRSSQICSRRSSNCDNYAIGHNLKLK